jgi:A/G-specific adenine glycosylase
MNRELNLTCLRADLLGAWPRFRRNFPWRNTRDPYALLIAEVLLHRTRANQVVKTYLQVLDKYPNVESLATADIEELSTLLHSAGLRWRVILLRRAAELICEKHGGMIPQSKENLEEIPGIGHYIASAIRCFAFGQPDALVDTNTVRVLTRVYGLIANDRTRRDQAFHKIADETLDPVHPREFNLALLDLAAAICTPRNPSCSTCPVLPHCTYGQSAIHLSLQPSR